MTAGRLHLFKGPISTPSNARRFHHLAAHALGRKVAHEAVLKVRCVASFVPHQHTCVCVHVCVCVSSVYCGGARVSLALPQTNSRTTTKHNQHDEDRTSVGLALKNYVAPGVIHMAEELEMVRACVRAWYTSAASVARRVCIHLVK